jgi:hypothetical protein
MVDAERGEIATGNVDDLGKPRQFDLLLLRQEIEIELLKEAVSGRRRCWRLREPERPGSRTQ